LDDHVASLSVEKLVIDDAANNLGLVVQAAQGLDFGDDIATTACLWLVQR
jgi:hypothetical protein